MSVGSRHNTGGPAGGSAALGVLALIPAVGNPSDNARKTTGILRIRCIIQSVPGSFKSWLEMSGLRSPAGLEAGEKNFRHDVDVPAGESGVVGQSDQAFRYGFRDR